MSSAAITTIVKMVESLSDDLQERVSEHIREYIADLEDEAKWESSIDRTRPNLVAAARQAKQEIAEFRILLSCIQADHLGENWRLWTMSCGRFSSADWPQLKLPFERCWWRFLAQVAVPERSCLLM